LIKHDVLKAYEGSACITRHILNLSSKRGLSSLPHVLATVSLVKELPVPIR